MKTFEEKMTRLEEINLILKDQKSTFSEMTALFEEGMKLSESLERELNDAEQKILLVKEEIQGKAT